MTGNKELSVIYHFLAQAMRYPKKNYFTDNAARLLNLLELLGWEKELQEFKWLEVKDSKTFEDLQAEYTRLFINAPGGVPAAPYGSVYISESGTLFNEATEAVEIFYRQHGFELVDDHDAADHIVNELEFLALLAADNLMTAEQLFLRQCFRPWFKQFYKLVREEAELPFYASIVKLIDFFTTPEEETAV